MRSIIDFLTIDETAQLVDSLFRRSFSLVPIPELARSVEERKGVELLWSWMVGILGKWEAVREQ